jgi:hypothetical protein
MTIYRRTQSNYIRHVGVLKKIGHLISDVRTNFTWVRQMLKLVNDELVLP